MRTEVLTVGVLAEPQLYNAWAFCVNPSAPEHSMPATAVVRLDAEYRDGSRGSAVLRVGQLYTAGKIGFARCWLTSSSPCLVALDVAYEPGEVITPPPPPITFPESYAENRLDIAVGAAGSEIGGPVGTVLGTFDRPAYARAFALVLENVVSSAYAAGAIQLDLQTPAGVTTRTENMAAPTAFTYPAIWYMSGAAYATQSGGTVSTHRPWPPPPRVRVRKGASWTASGDGGTVWLTARFW